MPLEKRVRKLLTCERIVGLIFTPSEDRAFGFSFALSFIRYLIVECKEAELHRVIWIDKLRHLLEVSAV